MNGNAVFQTQLAGLTLRSRGKVRDIYDLGDSLLIVATDRISAFDVVMPTPIPDKGKILTQVSAFWFDFFKEMVPSHLLATDADRFPEVCRPYREELSGRTMWVRKAHPLPVECIVRGYLVGSGWKDYQKTGAVCGIGLPQGLQLAQQLPEPIFTPSTKAEKGAHDENISFDEMVRLVGKDLAEQVRDLSLSIYQKGAAHARERGIILADTKLEFGLLDGKLILIDEVLTPDSSRFWPADRYQVGSNPESFDKQYLRDYLVASGWKDGQPAPELPQEVVENTRSRYLEALERLTGKGLEG
ncbi:phosphoribosylaminoimidazole-succinocarboxamide synthase [Desulfacinum hydrothermale DSM 13146]|uniref:Phosphoribosylaminoimidazole-succinocarboxamide synthase n=1 Tax=Desulfacinum hydrothermale DSM 13146 TaxID=1121390 RepID=A0A1W1XEV6_9BACT|nr:phosphoribosylaminoimidazolesuccinocarboxamide synthase [Desulfacinum hydrothermale]SMC22397.1 phosphoribosylaminoimidazole-succinocarboxamide synthase [Desulfacinum hydrothermale DSM 13146]